MMMLYDDDNLSTVGLSQLCICTSPFEFYVLFIYSLEGSVSVSCSFSWFMLVDVDGV